MRIKLAHTTPGNAKQKKTLAPPRRWVRPTPWPGEFRPCPPSEKRANARPLSCPAEVECRHRRPPLPPGGPFPAEFVPSSPKHPFQQNLFDANGLGPRLGPRRRFFKTSSTRRRENVLGRAAPSNWRSPPCAKKLCPTFALGGVWVPNGGRDPACGRGSPQNPPPYRVGGLPKGDRWPVPTHAPFPGGGS